MRLTVYPLSALGHLPAMRPEPDGGLYGTNSNGDDNMMVSVVLMRT